MNKEELIKRIEAHISQVIELGAHKDINVVTQMGKSTGEIIVTVTTTDPDLAAAFRRVQHHVPGTIPQSSLTPAQLSFLEACVSSCKSVTAGELREVGLEPNSLNNYEKEEVVYADADVVGVVFHTGRYSYSIVPNEGKRHSKVVEARHD